MTEDPAGARPLRTQPERVRAGMLADQTAAIERAAADLALAEEPAGFLAALEAGAPAAPADPAPAP